MVIFGMDIKKKVLITDVDNTLFDWFGMWHASFTALLDKVLEISYLPRNLLINEMREVFQRHGTSEYAFVLEECPSLKKMYRDPRESLDEAIVAYRNARDENLKLYEGVHSTLSMLQDIGVKIIAYTESLQYYTASRLEILKVAPFIDVLYSPPDHEGESLQGRLKSNPAPNLLKRLTPIGEFKPNPEILRKIISDAEAAVEQCIYVGDSAMKDMAMANQVGVTSIFAKYGTKHFLERPGDYDLLRSVSHWSDADVEREKSLKGTENGVSPDLEINSFTEILSLFE